MNTLAALALAFLHVGPAMSTGVLPSMLSSTSMYPCEDREEVANLESKQAEWAKEVRALPLPENPTDSQVLYYLVRLKQFDLEFPRGNLYGYYSFLDTATISDAVARIGEEHLPLLLAQPDLLDRSAVITALKKLDVSNHREALLQAARKVPDLYVLVIENGWAQDEVPHMLKSFDNPYFSFALDEILIYVLEHWKPEYKEDFKYALLHCRDHPLVMKTLCEVARKHRALHDELVVFLWQAQEERDFSGSILRDLMLLAFFSGEVDAAFPLLEATANRTEPNHVDRLLDDLNPEFVERTIQSGLGKSLPALQLMDWIMQHREQIRFDAATRRYVLDAPAP